MRRPEYSLSSIRRSRLPFHEVHIPAKVRLEKIHVSGTIGGRQVDCIIDTGLQGVQLPLTLRDFAGKQIDAVNSVDAGGNVSERTVCVLPELKIGPYKSRNLVVTVPENAPVHTEASNVDGCVLLGMDAFAELSLTIDYSASEIVLRDKTYNASVAFSSPNTLHLPMEFRSTRGINGRHPCITAYIDDHPFRMVVDTGWSSTQFGLTQAAIVRIAGLRSRNKIVANKSFLNGKQQVKVVMGLNFQLRSNPLPIDLNRDAILMPVNTPNFDGMVGKWVLQGFKITFDFPHRVLSLEPKYSTSTDELTINPREEVHLHSSELLLLGTQILPRFGDGAVVRFQKDKLVIDQGAQQLSIFAPEDEIRKLVEPADFPAIMQSGEVSLSPGKGFKIGDYMYLNTGQAHIRFPLPTFLENVEAMGYVLPQ